MLLEAVQVRREKNDQSYQGNFQVWEEDSMRTSVSQIFFVRLSSFHLFLRPSFLKFEHQMVYQLLSFPLPPLCLNAGPHNLSARLASS